ncbi:MAG: adenylate kinase family protein [Candidatus Aenigmarchaeota archaeon]|jgi:adenylate kinase|nr:adenylate kinase family protein [Candidatus Aenigmarchaeota archaeon]
MINMILSISGTPQTGKTSVAKALAKKLGWALVSLNQLAKEKGLYSGYDKARRSRIVDIKKLRTEIAKISRKEKNLILESHYSHDMPCDFVVILRTNPKELRKRMQKAGWNGKKIEENIEAEIMEIVKSEALENARTILEIDTTGKKPEFVAELIVRSLKLAR